MRSFVTAPLKAGLPLRAGLRAQSSLKFGAATSTNIAASSSSFPSAFRNTTAATASSRVNFFSTTPRFLSTANMSALKAGDSFPEGVAFSYAPLTPESSEITSCGVPQKFDASAGKSRAEEKKKQPSLTQSTHL